MRRIAPKTDTSFLVFANNLANECVVNRAAWNLDKDGIAHLKTLTEAANAAYANARDLETSSHLAYMNKSVSFSMLRKFLGLFIRMLMTNKAISNDILLALGLPSRVYHRPLPAGAPKLSVHQKQHLEIRVGVSVFSKSHPTASLTKKAYHGFVLRYRMQGETEWHEIYSTRLRTSLRFDNKDEGKHIILMAAWLNSRTRHGPWSNKITSLIN